MLETPGAGFIARGGSRLARYRNTGTCRMAGTGCHSAVPERFIKLHHAYQLAQPDLRQRNLGPKQVAIGIQGVQEGIHSTAIPDIRQPRPVLQGRDQQAGPFFSVRPW